MENKKEKKQEKKDSKKYVILFLIIVLSVCAIAFLIINGLDAKKYLASNLEVMMLNNYIDKIDYDMLYNYENFDDSAKFDYALKKYLQRNKDIKELDLEQFVKYYESVIGKIDISYDEIREKYFIIFVSNGIIYNPSLEKYSIEEIEKESEDKENEFYKRIIIKADKKGDNYTVYTKKVYVDNQEKVDNVTIENYKEQCTYVMDEVITLNLKDINNFKILSFAKSIEEN